MEPISMATPTTLKFGKFLVKLGDGGSPEIFSAPCGFTAKALNMTVGTADTNIPDCDDPDAPTWTDRDKTNFSAQVTGQGVLALESLPTWRAFFENTNSQNVRILLDVPLANNGGYYQGAMHCTAMQFGSNLGTKASLNITLVSDGPMTWTNASA
jgi:hypothetical protein